MENETVFNTQKIAFIRKNNYHRPTSILANAHKQSGKTVDTSNGTFKGIVIINITTQTLIRLNVFFANFLDFRRKHKPKLRYRS